MPHKTAYRAFVGLCVFLMVFAPASGRAQGAFRVHVDYLDNSQFPHVESFVSVSDAEGMPIENLTADLFTLTEDGSPIEILEFEPLQNTEQPLAIALIIDTSSSMDSKTAPTPLQRAVEAAKSFLGQLAPQDQVAVIKFSEGPTTVLELTGDKDAAVQALDALEPEKNKTDLFDAVVEGVKALRNYSGRRIIVVVTDGKDTGSGLFTFDDMLKEAVGNAIPIYPMGFGSVINVQQLKRMAELTGGAAQVQPTAADLQASFDTILQILRQQYKMSYVSTLPADNTEHELLVTVKYQGGQERTSYNFISKSGLIPVTLPGFQDGQVVGGLVDLTPTINWKPPLSSLELLVDGTLMDSITAEPFQLVWDSTKASLTPGAHAFILKAADVGNNTGQVNLTLDVQPPITVNITSLAEGDTVGRPTLITAEVTALTGISIQKVEFLVDGVVVSSLTAPPYEAEWDVRDYPAGPHAVTVAAYDSAGLFPTQKRIDVNVQVGNYSWMVPIIVLAVAAVIIPIAVRSRRRMGASPSGKGPASPSVLRELEGLNPGQAWPLGSAVIRLGRKRDENDIPLKGLKASRRHALIKFENGQYVVQSLSPDNPVLINGEPVTDRQILKSGDLIQLGETKMRYEG